MKSLINETIVKALAKQKSSREVNLITIDGNWVPPISGRFGFDFLNIWVTAKSFYEGNVFLQDAR
jgi:hypothetical protein